MMCTEKNKIGVSVIGTVGVPAQYGGFETLVENILENSDKTHFSYIVYCSGKSYKGRKREEYKGAQLKYIPLNANGIQSILYDIISIVHALFSSKNLLILGTSGCIVLPIIRLFSRKRIVVNIDGLEHRRGKWNRWAKIFLKFSEGMAIRFASVIITDNRAIQDYVKEEYKKASELIEYGGEHVLVEGDDAVLMQLSLTRYSYAFSVCRIEPENNIHLILQAFTQNVGDKLVIVGNWNKNGYGQKLKKQYAEYKDIYLLDPIYDIKLLNGLRVNCRYYIHGHSAGGTNPSLVETMNLGLPVIAYDVVYNRETTENRAFYFDSSETLVSVITNLSEQERVQNATKMRKIAKKRYQWPIITRKYEDLFC